MTKTRKKALFFIQNGVGGAERMTVNIQKCLPAEEWEVTYCKVVIPLILQSGRIDNIIPAGVNITSIVWSGQLSLLRQMRKMIAEVKPDVVFSSAMHINQRLLLISKLFNNIKFIVRNDNYLYTLPWLKQKTLGKLYKYADTVIAQTEEMAEELTAIRIPSQKIVVVHNMIDKERIDSLVKEASPYRNSDTIKFVGVGRVAYEKGFDLLIEAFATVLKTKPQSELFIVGNTGYQGGNVYKGLLQRIKEIGIANKVHFTGYTDNPYKYIKNADVFVLSSRNEGLPNVLIEAQYLGVPAAAFKCIPIIERIVANNVNGFLADKESVESLSKAMLAAYDLNKIKPTYHGTSNDDICSIFNS